MKPNGFYFYHSQKPSFLNKEETPVTIWLPLFPEAEQMVRHFKNKKPDSRTIVGSEFRNLFTNKEGIEWIDTEIKILPETRKKIFLYAQSDTLANSISVIGKTLGIHQLFYVVPKKSKEGADRFFTSKHIPFHTYSFGFLKKEEPNVCVMLNDWSKEAKRIISHCHLLKIPVICLQESVIDFGDHFKRMQWADYAFVQGIQSIIDLPRKSYYLTGNPRYENLQQKTPVGEYVLINCNFTYGIFEDKRESWLDDIHDVLKTAGQPYAISQHPRDKGDLSKYDRVMPSSSSQVADQLLKAGFLITRFSSLIHEALAMGIPVIYYNPHNELMQYDFEFDGQLLQMAKNKEELTASVSKLRSIKIDDAYLNNYLARHCLSKSNPPSKNIAHLLSTEIFIAGKMSVNDYFRMFFYHPTIKGVLSNIRKLFGK